MFSAKTHITKYRIEALADASLRSCYSEYCIELLDDYDLLYVDMAYKVSDGGIESFIRHLTGYIEENNTTEYNSFYKIDFIDAEAADTIFASDDNYESVKNKIIKHVSNNGINASYDEALDYYIAEKFSHKYKVKNFSVNEYEIEYIASGVFEELKKDEAFEEYPDDEDAGYEEYVEFDEQEYTDKLFGMLNETPENIKLNRLIDVITKNMRENYSPYFDFGNLVEGASITFYINGDDKTYETTKQFILN